MKKKLCYVDDDRPALGEAEFRLKQIKYRSDLRLEYLKRVYDRRPIFERYLAAEMCIHLHGLWYTHARFRKHQDILGVCFRVKALSPNGDVLGMKGNVLSMLVRVGEFFENQKTAMSVVRLQLLDECVVFDRDAFEVSFDTSREVVCTLTDRELRSAFRAGRLPTSSFTGCMNELIENSFKLSRYSSNFRAYVIKRVGKIVTNNVGIPWVTDMR